MCSGIFQSYFFSSPHPRNIKRFSFNVYCENLVWLLVVSHKSIKSVGTPRPPWLDPSGAFHSQTCSCWSSINSTIAVEIFPPQHWFLFLSFCFDKSRLAMFTCVSRLGDSSLPCVFPSLMNPRKGVHFFSLFSFVIVRMEWQLPNPLHGNQTRPSLVFLLSISYYGLSMIQLQLSRKKTLSFFLSRKIFFSSKFHREEEFLCLPLG